MAKRPTLLSDPAIAKLETAEERRVVRDGAVAGLQLRVTAGGAKSWALWYRTRAGQARLLTLGAWRPAGAREAGLSAAEARERALDLLARIRLGGDPRGEELTARAAAAAAPSEKLTVAGLVNRCLEGLRLRPNTLKVWRRVADREIIPALGDRPAADVTRGELREWLEGIVSRPAPGVANTAYVVLRRTYTWGIERDLVTVLPFIGLKKPAPEVRSERVMTAAEIAAALSALDVLAQPRALEGERPKHASKTGPGWPAYADAARLLFLTGVRRDMVLGMRRSELEDLNGTDPRWTIPGGFGGRSKSGKAHVVPLSAPAVEIIKRRLAAVSGELLFPLRRRGKLPGGERLDSRHMTWSSHFVSELQAQTAELAGAPVPGWTIHGIRHTVATHMREDLKVGREVVSTVLGHTQAGPSATRIYDRSELLPERRAALIAWAAWLDRIREAKRGADVLPMARTS